MGAMVCTADVHAAAGFVADYGRALGRFDAGELFFDHSFGDLRVFDGECAAETAALLGFWKRCELDAGDGLQETLCDTGQTQAPAHIFPSFRLYARDITDVATLEREFAAMHPKLQAEAISPILNKVGQFLALPVIRAVVGQPDSRLNLRTVLDERRVLLVNLSKGKIGDDASALL